MKIRMIAGAAALMAAPVAAQVNPSAQVLQRNPTVNPDRINEEQRRRLEDRANPELQAPTAPRVEAPPAAAPTAGDQPEVRFTLTAVHFDPSSYLSKAELDALVAPLIGREVSLRDLQAVVDRINTIYAERRLTTALAVLPAQEVDGGIVRIRLVEGTVGAITAEGGSARGRAYAARRGSPAAGSLAAPSAVERQLRLFNLNNDAQLRARLAPGTELGRTDVVLTNTEPARVGADVFVDNNGFASTGEEEFGVVLRGYRLLGGADRLTAVGVASRGVRSGNLNWSAPLGDRLRVGASASYGRTRVLFGQLADLDVRGTSVSFGGDLAALVVAGDRTSVTATGSWQTSFSRTAIAGNRVIDNRATNASAGLLATYAMPGLAVTVQNQLTVADVVEKLSGAAVRPVLFQGGLSIAKALAGSVQARVRADWQLSTSDNLPGILQYQIGGSRSSRAFSPGIAAGDSGLSATAELAYGATWQGLAVEPFVFVDHAQVAVPGMEARTEAAGAGLTLTYSPQIIVRGTLGTSIGHSAGLPGSTRGFVSTTFRF